MTSWLDPDPRVPDDSTPPRLPSDDGNPGTVIALVVLAAIVAALIAAVLYFAIATPRSAPESPSTVQGRTGAPHESGSGVGGGRSAAPEGLPASPTRSLYGAPLAAVTRTGWATWYDDGPGLYGAVRSWRWGNDPYTVQVCGFEGGRTNCVLVTIRDFCACGSRRGVPTVIDLSPAAFRSLAPLSRGVIRVTVDGVRGPSPRAIPTAPATDR